MKRVFIGGIVAGVAFFIWLSLVHLATPLGQVGVHAMRNEEDVLRSMKANITEPGFYLFPGAATAPDATAAERKAAMARAMEKMKTGPTGMMVVFPNGKAPLAPSQLLTELASDIVQGLLLAWIISRLRVTTIAERITVALVVGVAAATVTNVSYWNWYGFPTNYTMAYMFGQITGYVVMGAAIAVTLGTSREQVAISA